ncbi:hypothetical protein BH09ACT10_BH09ACT10_16040 [soil metagenome]
MTRNQALAAWLRRHETTSLRDRLEAVRRRWRLLIRLGIGTALAWTIATHVFGHSQAFFAPVAAVITIIAGAGIRTRTVFELMLGVAIGVLVGELLILGIGRGGWQIAVVVVLAVVVATLMDLKGLALTQAANSAILLAAVTPLSTAGNPAITRFIDALIGGVIGLAMVALVPRNPIRDIDRDFQALLLTLAGVLSRIAQALRTYDAALADLALDEARATQPAVDAMNATTISASEIARIAPMRWKQRDHVEVYASAVLSIDNAVRDARVLARKVSALLRHGEAVPESMDVAIDALANAVAIFSDDLAERDDFDEARDQLVLAARMASEALPGALTMNSGAVAGQVRSLAADLLYASGYTRDEIDERLDFD